MNFIIVGASGFVGKHLFNYLKKKGYNVVGTRYKSSDNDLITFDLATDKIADKIDPMNICSDRPTFGVICAFISQIDRCFREKEESYEINVNGIIRLIKEFNCLGIKPIFISTGSVFSGVLGDYNEVHRKNPICEYGRHKSAVEKFIEDNCPGALILRLDKVVGDNPKERHLFSEWYGLIIENKPIVCIKDQMFSPTFVDDIARAILLSCQKNLSGVYHLANNEFFSREELAKQFIDFFRPLVNYDREVISRPHHEFAFADNRPLKSYLDSNKFVASTGMRFTTMREIFGRFADKLGEKTSEKQELV